MIKKIFEVFVAVIDWLIVVGVVASVTMVQFIGLVDLGLPWYLTLFLALFFGIVGVLIAVYRVSKWLDL